MADDMTKEGTIQTVLTHDHADWAANRDAYNFPEIAHGPVTVRSVKNSDRTISIAISGPFGGDYDFREPIPRCDDGRLTVSISWGKGEVILYLNGQRVKTRRSHRTVH